MAYIGKKPTDKPLSSADLADNIVTSAKILDGTIANADVNDVAASKLTGALPAISGASLTALTATNLGSGTVPTARLGSGTASSSTFLRGDQSYAVAGGGKVGQVVSQAYQSTYTVTSQNAWGAMPTATLTITPTATSSKILVMFDGLLSNYNWGGIRLYRNIGGAGVAAVTAAHGTASSSRQGGWVGHIYSYVALGDQSVGRNISAHFLDSPSTTSACVYQLYVTSHSANATYMGRSYSDADVFSSVRNSTIWTGMEILA